MRSLALLDIDGTLTATTEVDMRCYLGTLEELFGFSSEASDYDWAAIRHATDPGLLLGAFEQFAGRPPTEREEERFFQAFLAALARAAHRTPDEFRPVAGARRLVAHLASLPDWDFAIATGCWLESALLKLELAGLAETGRPLTTASEALSREEIFARAAREATKEEVAAAIVLVGDAPWDAVTARRLGLAFVGVAGGARARELERLGAASVLPDFTDLELSMAALVTAARKGGELLV